MAFVRMLPNLLKDPAVGPRVVPIVADEARTFGMANELERDARAAERWNHLHPALAPRTSHLAHCLSGLTASIVAASDYVRAWPQLIAAHAPAPFTALDTDGFGRSDTRAALRSFFEVDRHQIVLAALTSLAQRGELERSACAMAIERYGIATEQDAPWKC